MALAKELLRHGARTVYAAVRNQDLDLPVVVPIEVDVDDAT
ncbi:hypothetical protein AB0A81_36730 [Streptomyces flaveolus]|uniref:Uncharacterized protein n=1 Tax=Streptomyces flaveolus TaxID=67297 RepID=A0ABV1VSP3_9ACTN